MREETAGFTKASREYERGRPGYPACTVAWIVERGRLGPGRTVVDLAAGTGKLTRELVASHAGVIAVEPLEEMRARLTESLPEVRVVAGTAEETGLESASADGLTVAQAFHWFSNQEALGEIARVLRQGGRLFLVWNRRELSDRLQAAISRLTLEHVGDTPSYGTGAWQKVMEASPHFVLEDEHHTRFFQEVDRDRLVDRVASTSYIARLSDEVRLPLLEKVGALLEPGETAQLPYSTDSYCYSRL